MKKTAFVIMIITIVSKLLGFFRDVNLSYFYGASNISDAYLISLTVPEVIFSFIGIGISISYIPIYNRIDMESGHEEADRYTSNLSNITMLICTVIFAVVFVFAEPIVRVFASGFGPETVGLAVSFTRIGLVSIYFRGLVYIFSGFLQIKGSYFVPAMLGIPLNLITIAAIMLSSKTDVRIIAVGTVASAAAQMAFLAPFLYKKGYRHRPAVDLRDRHIKEMMGMALPLILGLSVNQINLLIGRTIASGVAVGGISALDYSTKLNDFVQGLFVISLATVMYPMISRMAVENDMDGLKRSVSEVTGIIILMVLPVTVGAMVFARPIVELLFGRGAFDVNAIEMTSSALFFYSIGMIGFGLREILSRVFYSLQDARTPMVNAALAVVMNIALSVILSRFMGIGGLALATSIAAIFCTFLLLVSLRRKIGSLGLRMISISFVKVLAASVLMGLAARATYEKALGFAGAELSLLAGVLTGMAAFFLLVYLMRVEEIGKAAGLVKRRLNRRNDL